MKEGNLPFTKMRRLNPGPIYQGRSGDRILLFCRAGFAVFFLVLAGLGMSGCSTDGIYASDQERKESGLVFKGLKIGGLDARQFIWERSAILIRADTFERLGKGKTSTDVTLVSEKGSGEYGLGGAVAVDSRGYFLTAAHCLGEGAPLLSMGKNMDVIKSRVVWRGDPAQGGPDLALLHVPLTLPKVFQWRQSYQTGDVVYLLGSGYTATTQTITNEFISGKMLQKSNSNETKPSCLEVRFNAPLHKGDSGGPVVGADGQLIAVTTVIDFEYQPWKLGAKPRWGEGLKPDLKWLADVIGDDQAQLLKKKKIPKE